MSMEIGIVGLPNVGKSTLFNALTRAGAAVASYPFTTIEPNVGMVPVADPRLDDIARIIDPREVIPTTVRFVDIAGLVQGASQGEGLGNQFLGHIRTVDAVAVVVRCFAAGDVPHVSDTLDPDSDIAVIDTELLLADLATIERRIEKVRTSARVQPKEHAADLQWLTALRDHVAAGRLARTFGGGPIGHGVVGGSAHSGGTAGGGTGGTAGLGNHEPAWAHGINLLTARPRMFVMNIGESDLPDGGPLAARVAARAASEGVPAVPVCARLEADLSEWPADEAAAYRADLGQPETGLVAVVRAAYQLLDLITFFTTTGQIVQAWTVRRGTPAPQAAGRIHSDLERGFIRAEVAHYDDLVAQGTLHAVREHGLLHLEGRDYAVRDGDVIHFRFAV